MASRFLYISMLVFAVGCTSKSQLSEPNEFRPDSAPGSKAAFQSAVDSGNWDLAFDLSSSVLVAHPDDADLLALVARVAFEKHELSKSAELLVAAAELKLLANEAFNGQATVGLISAGRLFDAIDFLTKVVEAHPDQSTSRRLLFDLLTGLGDVETARLHGQVLVRQRRFDSELMLNLGYRERRLKVDESLQAMLSRWPTDRRPLMDAVIVAFDAGHFTRCEELLREILKSQPDYVPARMMLGRVLTETGQFKKVAHWIAGATKADANHSDYWVVIGDGATSEQQADRALAAYVQAIRLDPDSYTAWLRLASALSEHESTRTAVSNLEIAAVQNRLELLSQLRTRKERYSHAGSNDPILAIDIAQALLSLDRGWESEAWCSVALMHDPDSELAARFRKQVLSRLRSDSAWHLSSPLQTPLDRLASLPCPDPTEALLEINLDANQAQRALSTAVVHHAPGVIELENQSKQRQLNFFGRTSDSLEQPGLSIYATYGCGLGVIDYDQDGWPDLYLADAGGTPPNRDSRPNVLMRNTGGKFLDVTMVSATGDTGFGQGVSVGDMNSDGFPDLYVSNYGPNRILINNGDGTFSDRTSDWFGELPSRWSTSGAIADINGDGISDLVEVNYCAGLDPVTKKCMSESDEHVGVCSPMAFAAESDRFFFGSSKGRFLEASSDAVVGPAVLGRGLGVTAGDFDDDQKVDVFVANDMTDNHYWRQSAARESLSLGSLSLGSLSLGSLPLGFQLSETGILRGLAGDGRSQPQGSMGIATGDLDRDGHIDFYVTNFASEFNTLYRQRPSGGYWGDQTGPVGLIEPTLELVGFGTRAIDLDNNGDLEIVVANGHVDPGEQYAQHFQVFQQRPSGKYEWLQPTSFSGYLSERHVGRALVSLDFNRDRVCDLAVTHQTEPMALLCNASDTNYHSISLRLRGTTCDRDAVGASVIVTAGNASYYAIKTSGDGYMGSNDDAVWFGLGKHSGTVSVQIRWPGGTRQSIAELSADQEWLIVENREPYRLE